MNYFEEIHNQLDIDFNTPIGIDGLLSPMYSGSTAVQA